jgi:hypothetical protein
MNLVIYGFDQAKRLGPSLTELQAFLEQSSLELAG